MLACTSKYPCYKSLTEFHWEVAKPINKTHQQNPSTRFPDGTEESSQPANQLTHFELLHIANTHYDSIVEMKSGTPSAVPPVMIPRLLADITNKTITLDS